MHRMIKAVTSWAVLAALVPALAFSAGAEAPPGVDRIASGGFNDHHNNYSWAMAWFKGKLYVGTARDPLCVDTITLDFFYPGTYKSPPDGFPEADCPPDKYDLDLRAEIWQFTPETGVWRRVYQSPADIPNPRAPGKFVARDIGFRGMVVYKEPNGEEALYVGGVTADEYIPEIAKAHPPRILRTTDGETFTPLPRGPGIIHDTFGRQRAMGFRAMVVFDDRLFVTASGGITGDGVIMEVKKPASSKPAFERASSKPAFEQVSPATMQVFEMEVFNGSLYAGVGDPKLGYSVWKATNRKKLKFKPIVTDGAGRGLAITSVVSMHVYDGRLYVGSSGWGVFPASELIRINPDDTWDLVAGNPRIASGSLKYPISGLWDGLGNIFSAHFWRMETHEGAMYLGTNDWSWGLRNVPILGDLLAPEFGFDEYGTCDGQFWWRVTRDGFGDGRWNFGARTIVSSPAGAFLGTTNHIEGTSVWRSQGPSPCGGDAATASGTGGASVATNDKPARGNPPRRVLADVRPCGTVLTWDRPSDSKRFRIERADYSAADVDLAAPPALPGGEFAPDLPPTPASPGDPRGKRARLWVERQSVSLGTTTGDYFVDRDSETGARYRYEVIAEDGSGDASQPSNFVTVEAGNLESTKHVDDQLKTQRRGRLPNECR